LGRSHRDTDDRVRANSFLVRGPIELEKFLIEIGERREIPTAQVLCDLVIYVLDRAQDASTPITHGIAIAKFGRFL
jgi:hypothetical protein